MRIVKAQDEQGGDQSISLQSQDTISVSPASKIQGARDVSAFIGRGVHFKGTLTYEGTVRIDGAFDGEITTDGVVLVGEGAELKANVTAGTIVSKGKISGDIRAKETLILQAPSVTIGDVTATKLSIEEGAILDGGLKMGQESSKQELYRDFKREPALRAIRSSEQFAVRRMAI
jgi:cytoskeletal protein CcmA (bactofilin family)